MSGFHIRTFWIVGEKYNYCVERGFMPFKVFFYKNDVIVCDRYVISFKYCFSDSFERITCCLKRINSMLE